MRTDIVLKKLEELGVKITERTLQRYIKDGLVPMPERKSGGKGKGRITDHPDETVAETFASYHSMRGDIKLSPKIVENVRDVAIRFDRNPFILRIEPDVSLPIWIPPLFLVDWLLDKGKAEINHPDGEVEITYFKSCNKWHKTIEPADEGRLYVGAWTENRDYFIIEFEAGRTSEIDYRLNS